MPWRRMRRKALARFWESARLVGRGNKEAKMRRIVLVVLLGTYAAGAQPAGPKVAFHAVSIKPFPEGSGISMSGCMGGPGTETPARITCEYVTLKTLLMRAYGVRNQEISGPGWIDSTHFNLLI